MSRSKLASFVFVAIACAAGAAFLLATIAPASVHSASAAVGDDVDTTVITPLWSPRRAPTVLEGMVVSAAQTRAADSLTKLLTAIVAPVHACVAVDGVNGPLARVDTDTPLAPASTLKLLTATAALDKFGADHRFTTRVVSGPNGDLDIIGGGDPMLATPAHIATQNAQLRFRDAKFTPLSDLADAIVAAGVHQVSGALVVDDHVHDTLRYLPAWKAIYGQEGDVGSLGALTVDGGDALPSGGGPAADPAITTGRQLASLLAARGVTIAGGVHRGLAPLDAHEVAHVDSPPLSAIVAEMLTSSDNYTAEELLRDLAVGANGAAAATTEAGTQIVEHEMGVLGIPATGLVMHDGSGLAPDDRVSCTTMLHVIDLSTQPKFAAIDKGLAIAGRTGTLAGRFIGDPLAGNLRAKTGSIGGVVGLVGTIDGPDDLHFAFIANGDFSTGAGEVLQNQIAAAVGATPDIRAPSDLVPAP